MTTTLNDAWNKLQRYFEIMHNRDEIMEAQDDFKLRYLDDKIVYRGKHPEFAKQLVNKKFLVIENKR